jgi:hypothetical protein
VLRVVAQEGAVVGDDLGHAVAAAKRGPDSPQPEGQRHTDAGAFDGTGEVLETTRGVPRRGREAGRLGGGVARAEPGQQQEEQRAGGDRSLHGLQARGAACDW